MTQTAVTPPATPIRAMALPFGAGVLVGFNLTLRVTALAVLVFFGPFASGLATGVSLMLLVTGVVTVALFLRPDTPPVALGAAQDAPIAILMPAILALAATMPPGISGGATVFAVLGATSVLAGLFMLVLAGFDLARIVRLLPFPVIAGYLASTGALLIGSSIQVAHRASGALGDASGVVTLGLVLGFAGLMAGFARWRSDVGPILATAVALGAFFLWAQQSGSGAAELRQMGLLPPVLLTTPADLQAQGFADIDWRFVLDMAPTLLAAAAIATLGAVLNVSGVELVARSDMSHKKALANTGCVNLVFGAFGTSPAYLSASTTTVAMDLGGASRVSVLVACAFVIGSIWFAPAVLPFVPVFVSSGVLIYIGWVVLVRWFVGQRHVVSGLDWLQIGFIVAVAITFGMLEAIAVGIVIASLTFAVTYGRLPVVRRITTMATQRSTVDRGPAETAWLDRQGDTVALVELQGFLFFGSVERLVQTFRVLLSDSPKVQTIVLDFNAVSGIDSASVEALRKLEFLAETGGKTVVLSGLKPDALGLMQRGGLALDGQVISVRQDLDQALEQIETRMLQALPDPQGADGAAAALIASGASDADVVRLTAVMTKRWLAKSERLIRAGDAAQDIYLIASGRLGVFAPLKDGGKLRVRSLRAGAFVGEIASYAGLNRTADVVAEEPSVVYEISPKDIEALTQTDPDLAAIWHKMIARTLADKLDRTNRLLRDRT